MFPSERNTVSLYAESGECTSQLTSVFPWSGQCWSSFCQVSRDSLTSVGCGAPGPASWWRTRWQWQPLHHEPWPQYCSPIHHMTQRLSLGKRDGMRWEETVYEKERKNYADRWREGTDDKSGRKSEDANWQAECNKSQPEGGKMYCT